MLNQVEASKIVKDNLPFGKIQKVVPYKDVWLFQVFNKRPGEEIMDPFFSVHRTTGEFKEFSIITDGSPQEITELFA